MKKTVNKNGKKVMKLVKQVNALVGKKGEGDSPTALPQQVVRV
jgi:hypothetical protein